MKTQAHQLTMHCSKEHRPATLFFTACVVVFAMLPCRKAHAAYDFQDGALRLSGFGTVAATRTTTDEVSFGTPGKGNASKSRWSTHPDSKLAVQARYQFSPQWSMTAQALSRHQPDGNYKPDLDWAFVRWEPSDQTSVRLGRIGAPLFMVSEARDVGYANLQVRPPLDVYIQVPLSRLDGGDVMHRMAIGDSTVTASLWAGSSSTKAEMGLVVPGLTGDFELGSAVGANIMASIDQGLSLRAGFARAKLKTTASGLSGVPDPILRNFESTFIANNAPISFSGLGLAYDKGSWTASAEYTWRRSATFVPDTTGWYATVGYRLGKFIPYAGLSRLSVNDLNKSNPYADQLQASGWQGDVARLFQLGLDSQKNQQQTQTLGVRWDPVDRIAVKFQWDHVRKPQGSYGAFISESPASVEGRRYFEEKRQIDVFTVAVDFVF